MPPELFFTARYYVVFLAVMGLLNAGMAVFLFSVTGPQAILLIFLAGAIVLGGLAFVEGTKPVIEVLPDRIVVRTARARAPFVLPREPRQPLRIESSFMGPQLVRTDGGVLTSELRFAGVANAGGKRFLIGHRMLGAADRKRLHDALERWISGD